jgi:protein kinase domain-containing protein
MFNAGRHFTTFLLPHGAPPTLRPLIDRVVKAFQTCTSTTKELVAKMDKVVQLYKSGAYLNRSRPEQFQTSKQ